MSLNQNQFFYVLKFHFSKELWDNLEMIYGFSPIIGQKGMKTQGKEEKDEFFFHKRFLTVKNVANNVRTFLAKKYLRIKKLKQTYYPILKLRYGNIYNLPEKFNKE